MIELTDEMVRAFSDADFTGCGNADWEDSHVRIGLAAVLALAERDLLARIEGPRGEGICDCDDADDPPINALTGRLMGHHCDCRAVETAAVVLGSATLTRHHAECVCGR